MDLQWGEWVVQVRLLINGQTVEQHPEAWGPDTPQKSISLCHTCLFSSFPSWFIYFWIDLFILPVLFWLSLDLLSVTKKLLAFFVCCCIFLTLGPRGPSPPQWQLNVFLWSLWLIRFLHWNVAAGTLIFTDAQGAPEESRAEKSQWY